MVSKIQNRITILDKDFKLIQEETTKEFFAYFEFTVDIILDAVHEADKEKFINFMNGTEHKRTAVIRFFKNTQEYKYNLITVIKDFSDGKKKIQILEIDEIMEKNDQISQESRFLRKILSISGEFMFNYNVKTDNIRIVQYANNSKIIISDMPLDMWKEHLLDEGFVSDDDKNDLDILIYDLRQVPSNFNHKIAAGIRTLSHVKENLRFIGTVHEELDKREKFVIGRILTDEDMKQALSSQNLIGELQIDQLTQLYNKKTITNFVQQKIQAGNKKERFALVIMDLDNFKPINDQFGHMAGDTVLSRVALRVNELIGEDGVVGRIGGDEFMLVLNEITNVQVLRGFLRAILVQVRKEFEGNFEGVNLTCSLGAAVYPTNGDNYDELFQKADFCLYTAKDKGRDRYVFFRDDMHAERFAEFMGAKRTGQKTDRREIQELKYMEKFFRGLKFNRRSSVRELLKHMLGTYLIDSIKIYYGPEMKQVFSLGIENLDLSEAKYALSDDFKKELVDARYIQYDFQSEFPKEGALTEALHKRKTCSTLQFILGTCNDILGLIVFDKIRAPGKWAEYEVSCASIIATTLDIVDLEDLSPFPELKK